MLHHCRALLSSVTPALIHSSVNAPNFYPLCCTVSLSRRVAECLLSFQASPSGSAPASQLCINCNAAHSPASSTSTPATCPSYPCIHSPLFPILGSCPRNVFSNPAYCMGYMLFRLNACRINACRSTLVGSTLVRSTLACHCSAPLSS